MLGRVNEGSPSNTGRSAGTAPRGYHALAAYHTGPAAVYQGERGMPPSPRPVWSSHQHRYRVTRRTTMGKGIINRSTTCHSERMASRLPGCSRARSALHSSVTPHSRGRAPLTCPSHVFPLDVLMTLPRTLGGRSRDELDAPGHKRPRLQDAQGRIFQNEGLFSRWWAFAPSADEPS